MINTNASSNLISADDYQRVLRRDFTSFIERSFYKLRPGQVFQLAQHIELIAAKLEQVRRGEIKRLVINLPPRSLKSIIVSVAFVGWMLGYDPTMQIICASYGQDLANDLAMLTRRLMQSRFYRQLFGSLLAGRQAIEDFGTTLGGRRVATSVGGALTGRGADLIIIDDPQKADDALSESGRKATHTWFDNTLFSRLNDKENGAIIIVCQRLHQDDLVGHVLEQGHWDVLALPAIAAEEKSYAVESILGKRIYTRHPGDVLHPERESQESLAQTRMAIGEFSFASQYQQTPIPLGGAIVKRAWLRYYAPGEEPKFWTTIQSWDTANKSGELNDYSVCTTWGYVKDKFYLLYVFRRRLDFPNLKREVVRLREEFRPNKILVEDKASGTQLIQELKEAGIFETFAYAPPAGADKIMRLHAQTAPFENGAVFLPGDAPWLADFVNELTGFPGSRYADQVDSTTQALDYLRTTYRNDSWINHVDWDAVERKMWEWGFTTRRDPHSTF